MAPVDSLSSMSDLINLVPPEPANPTLVFILGVIVGLLCLGEPKLRPQPMRVIRQGNISREHVPDGCMVCGHRIVEGQDVIGLPYCHHMFHASCIIRRLDQYGLCPSCGHFVDAGFVYRVAPSSPDTDADDEV
uniref:RING-type domain-containing protein n=1 Tax=Fagus sylvatica TaxID=28930 RepID=A0A2N9IPS6_FAGSY